MQYRQSDWGVNAVILRSWRTFWGRLHASSVFDTAPLVGGVETPDWDSYGWQAWLKNQKPGVEVQGHGL